MASIRLVGALACALAFEMPAHAQTAEDTARPELMPAAREWTPLDPARLGAELFERWVPVPDGASAAPRQGWLNTADGFFTREVHLAYDYIDAGAGDSHRVLSRINYPLSRRFWVGLEIPFVQTANDRSAFGDLGLTAQIMLVETRNLSLNAGVGFQLPTGGDDIGAGGFGIGPQLNLWTDLGAGVSLRGRVGYVFRDERGTDGFAANLALGQTITPADRVPLGQFTYYLSANVFQPDGEARTFFSLTPGIRTRLVGSLFFLAGVEVPVVNRNETFEYRGIGQFVFGF